LFLILYVVLQDLGEGKIKIDFINQLVNLMHPFFFREYVFKHVFQDIIEQEKKNFLEISESELPEHFNEYKKLYFKKE